MFIKEICSELRHEFTIKELGDNARNKTDIPKKLFFINNKLERFSRRLHFFTSARRFPISINPREKPIDFTCKICKVVISVKFPYFTNLSHHLSLDKHTAFQNWLSLNGDGKKIITDSMLALIKYLVASNAAFQTIDRPELLAILSPSLKEQVPCYKTLRYALLPSIFKSLRAEINSRLFNAKVSKINYFFRNI